MKSKAPVLSASTAFSIVAYAVSMITGRLGSSRSALRSSSMPSTCGIFKSVMTRSMWCSLRSEIASAPSPASWTS